MSPFQIKCFKQNGVVPENAFFILSKGRNTGRPSFDPCPNCFVFTCKELTDLNSYYWLVYALWAGNRFHPYLIGSVIEFIHLRDLIQIVSVAADQVDDLEKVACHMKQVINLEKNLQNQFVLLKQAKLAVLRDWIR